jgi:hypothetical protein
MPMKKWISIIMANSDEKSGLESLLLIPMKKVD